MKSHEKLILLVLALINFTNIIDVMVVAPMNPLFAKQFGITPQQFGILVSSYAFSAGVSGFVTSFIMDKYDRKNLLLLMYGGFAVGTLLCGMSHSYQQLLLARSLTGLFGGVLFGLVMSIVSDVIPPARRGTGMGILMTSFSLASTLGVPFGLYLANEFSLQMPFLVLAFLALLILGLVYAYVPPINQHLQHKPQPFFHAMTSIANAPNQRLALLMSFLMNVGQFIYIPFLSDYCVANVGFTTNQLPLIYLVGGISTFFTAPLIGRAVDKLGRVRIFTIFGLLFLVPLYLCTNMGKVELSIALGVIALFFIMNNGRMVASSTIVSMAAPSTTRGSFMSFNATINSFGMATGSFLGGQIIQKAPTGAMLNYHVVGYVALAIAVAVVVLGRLIRNEEVKATYAAVGHETL